MDVPTKHASTLANAGIITREALMAELSIKKDDTLREWEKDGLPYIKQGQQVMYHVPSVVKWLLRRQRKSRG